MPVNAGHRVDRGGTEDGPAPATRALVSMEQEENESKEACCEKRRYIDEGRAPPVAVVSSKRTLALAVVALVLVFTTVARMRPSLPLAILPALALQAQSIRIIQGNDDGWAELYVRTFNDALNAAGHDVVLSAPAENKSGAGSTDVPPSPRKDACEFDSCPPNAGPMGTNITRPDLNWVNSFPVTSIKFGIETFGPQLWDGAAPDLAVTGPNVGSNLWLAVPFSGTVGAACFAAHDKGIPAIAFSGADNINARWDTSPVPLRSQVYADLATKLTNKVIDSGKPYLPQDVFLNVNFPHVEGNCQDVSKFKFVLSRINPGTFSSRDVDWCGSTRLPTEHHVLDQDGCYVSISVGDAKDKTTASADAQDVVLDKLRDILTCLP